MFKLKSTTVKCFFKVSSLENSLPCDRCFLVMIGIDFPIISVLPCITICKYVSSYDGGADWALYPWSRRRKNSDFITKNWFTEGVRYLQPHSDNTDVKLFLHKPSHWMISVRKMGNLLHEKVLVFHTTLPQPVPKSRHWSMEPMDAMT